MDFNILQQEIVRGGGPGIGVDRSWHEMKGKEANFE